MIYVRTLIRDDRHEVFRINATSRPAVASLDENERSRLLAVPNHHLVATNGSGRIVAYVLAFDARSSYDGEEFQELRRTTQTPFVYIDPVAVQETSRGTELQKALYAALECMAESRGGHFLCCEVNTVPPNPESMVFHGKMRFSSIGSLATSDGRQVELLIRVLCCWSNPNVATSSNGTMDAGFTRRLYKTL
jgi:hypothetical protein